ncbi:MAG: hypothetical protein LBN23_08930 [Paludibacter sp.]|jgi:cell division protein FtsB|nr:hypothetical protein [Paludibacter sp.]
MKFLKKHWLWLVYIAVLVGYAVNITFFDERNLINRHETDKLIQSLENQRDNYLDKIKTDRETSYLLEHDDEFLEKFAREHYYFKKADEDIFIVNKINAK